MEEIEHKNKGFNKEPAGIASPTSSFTKATQNPTDLGPRGGE